MVRKPTIKEILKFRDKEPEKSLFLNNEHIIKLLTTPEKKEIVKQENKIKIIKGKRLKVGDKVLIDIPKDYNWTAHYKYNGKTKSIKSVLGRYSGKTYNLYGISSLTFRRAWLKYVEEDKNIVIKKENIIKKSEKIKIGDYVQFTEEGWKSLKSFISRDSIFNYSKFTKYEVKDMYARVIILFAYKKSGYGKDNLPYDAGQRSINTDWIIKPIEKSFKIINPPKVFTF